MYVHTTYKNTVAHFEPKGATNIGDIKFLMNARILRFFVGIFPRGLFLKKKFKKYFLLNVHLIGTGLY